MYATFFLQREICIFFDLLIQLAMPKMGLTVVPVENGAAAADFAGRFPWSTGTDSGLLPGKHCIPPPELLQPHSPSPAPILGTGCTVGAAP